MIKAEIKVFKDFPRITFEIEEKSKQGLLAAETAGALVATQRVEGLNMEVHKTGIQETTTGYRSGIKFSRFLWKIYNKGSLGKRSVALKQPGRRRPEWPVKQRHREYIAHRHEDLDGKGVEAREIINPARTAGRNALISFIHRK